MSNDATTETDERQDWSKWAIAAALVLLLLFGVIAVGTVRGCFSSDPEKTAEATEKKKKDDAEKEKKPPIKIDPPIVLPSEPKVPLPPVKPGHWATASQEITANFQDFVGDSQLSVVDGQGRPYPVASTPFYVRSSRPVLLAKARPKSTQTTFFIPQSSQTVRIALDLEDSKLGSGPAQAITPLVQMPSYQYNFVVLARSPSRYSYIKTVDSVKSPFNGEFDEDNTEEALHYLVVELGADQLTLLPDNPLAWTSVAYVLWDQIDPGEPFPAEQKKALVDWINWGGQLIINGPDSLDTLKGSFLDPYLPATSGGTRKFDGADKDLASFSEGWMISTPAMPGVPLRPTAAWSGIKLELRPRALAVPNTGGLFVERQVGRGRIVVSAIQLSERDLINWRSGFESFFNGGLLRRPPRKYFPGHFGSVTLNWRDPALKERRLDASLNTNLKFFTRDLGVDTSYHHAVMPNDQNQLQQLPPAVGARLNQRNPSPGPPVPGEYRPPVDSGGVGAWNDYSATARAARQSLREAAGVEVPDSGFVVLCLAGYLVALVPLNWLLFRSLGRIEWAWIAAPIIAIIGTWVIVQRAQLDIGFVRSQTEIGILETQPDHARGHLSRYTALYTSLSTTYDFEFANMTTLIAPFPAELDPASFQLLSGQGISPISFRRYESVQLNGIPVSSNSTGMVHSEQMIGLDGPIQLTPAQKPKQVTNNSSLTLRCACIVERVGTELGGQWIGDFLPGQSVPLPSAYSPAEKRPFAAERTKEAGTAKVGRLNLEQMFQLALDPNNIDDGETRLVARVDEVLAGQSIEPAASQVRGGVLVVAHLRYAALATDLKPDANTRQEIKATETQSEEAKPIKL